MGACCRLCVVAGRRRNRVAATQPPATSTPTLATERNLPPASDGSAIARITISSSEEDPLLAGRSGQLAEHQERHGQQQPALGAAGERERDAEQRPVEHDERV
jgi:hypothetical protein